MRYAIQLVTVQKIKFSPYLLIIACLFASCAQSTSQKEKTGEELAKIYCASCHLFPDPSLLDKKAWKENVLPPMAKQLGIDYIFEAVLPNRQPAVTIKEWKDILSYYINSAPDRMPGQSRQTINKFTGLFREVPVLLQKGSFPATSFLKIDTANHRIYAANAFDSSLEVYDQTGKMISHNKIRATLVDMNFNEPGTKAGERSGIFTDIGIMNPNDKQQGQGVNFSINKKGTLTGTGKFLDSLPRPVQITWYDLDGDGTDDYLVCGFGNTSGALFWMKGMTNGKFEKKIISPFPGAIRAYVEDINKDGLPDIVTLMTQAAEGIFIYLNKGNGLFETKKALGFPPIFGSSYFELVDFNKDGYKDLLYTCGDNGDYTPTTLKNYHGVYIYLNDGKNNFQQKYFFPIYGCYKAMAKDFDKDGDLDIAAISFFPDSQNQPQESFVYLEQTGVLDFTPSTIKGFDEGRWMTMDAGDLDGDGFEDIVLGSLIPPIPVNIQAWKKSSRQKSTMLLLLNQHRQ